jgi:hypothetical protein
MGAGGISDATPGWTVKHFHEHLTEHHGFRSGYSWTKAQLHSAGLVERTSGARQAFVPRQGGVLMSPTTSEIGAVTLTTLRIMRAKLDKAAAVARAAEGCAADGQPGRAPTMALDFEPLAIEANQLLQGLAILSRVAREEQDDAEGL